MLQPRILQWTYGKNQDTLECELEFKNDTLTYELTTSRNHTSATTRVERFQHVTHAFMRHTAFESRLIGDGWSLVGYRSRVQ